MKIIIMFLAGALASMLANRSVAVFNDAVRPIIPEFREGRMSRVELATTTFALSIGLVIGFGIPFSMMYPIIIVHSLFLGTDIIGTFFPGIPGEDWLKDKKSVMGLIGSGLAGGAYGVLLVVGLQWFIDALAAFPALAVAMEYGYKKGALTLALTVIVRQIIVALDWGKPDGWALLAGMLILMMFAVREKSESRIDTAALFSDRVKNIKKNIIWIALMGGLYGMAANINLLMEGPQSLVALGEGAKAEAITFTIARAFSFIPLKGMTSLATGTFVTDGFGFVATVGLLSPNIIIAGIAGAIVITLEASSLILIAKYFDKFPGIKKAADNMRTAMTKLLEVALIVGSMIAANTMAPGFGFFVVAGIYLLNETAKKPMVKMAVGPVAAIFVGILINVLALIGLYPV